MGIRTKFNPLGGVKKNISGITKVACSNSTTWFIDKNGDLYGCGTDSYGAQGNGNTSGKVLFTKRTSNVVDVMCSDYTTWYLDSNGDLYGTGYNSVGQQGSGGTTNVETFTKRASNVVKFDCAGYTTWYLDSNGDLYGCGNNQYGQQGNGTTSDVTTFTKRASNVVDFSSSDLTTWYLDSNGNLYGCGWNTYGQQGSGNATNVTTFTKRASNVAQVVCGSHTTWYLTNDGDLYGCGSSEYGQQGNGTYGNGIMVTTFTKRANNVINMACDWKVSWYIDKNGDLYGCGNNSGNQGNGSIEVLTTFENKKQFLSIPLLEGAGSVTLAAGKYFIELVGGGTGYSFARSAYASTLDSSHAKCAQAVAGGSSGAAYVGEVILSDGKYTLTQGTKIAGSASTVYSQNGTAVGAQSASSSNHSTLSKGSTLLIRAGGANRGYAWADYNSSPYYNGYAGSGGTLTINDNSIIENYLVSSNGNSGTYGGGRNTSTSGSMNPASYTNGSSVYAYYGAGSSSGGDGIANIYYRPYAT